MLKESFRLEHGRCSAENIDRPKPSLGMADFAVVSHAVVTIDIFYVLSAKPNVSYAIDIDSRNNNDDDSQTFETTSHPNYAQQPNR